MVKTNFRRLTFDAKEVNGMPLEYISNDNPKKNLYDTLRKFQLNTLLCVISKETATFFAEENSGLNFGIKYETYQLCEKMTKKCVDVNTYVTGWTLLDLSYNAICCTHDYRGTGEITPQTVWFLSQLSGEYLGSLESAAIDNFEDTDMDMILYLWGFFGEQRKVQNPGACFENMKRDLYILFDIAKGDREIDIAGIVDQEIGVDWKTVQSALYLFWAMSIALPYISEGLDQKIAWRDDTEKAAYLKVLDYYTTDYETIKESSLGRQQLYITPYVRTSKGRDVISVNCFLNLFLCEHSIMWLVRNYYKKKDSQKFVDRFGMWFEKYLGELLREYVGESDFKRICEERDMRADWRAQLDKYSFLIEQKSALLRIDVKQQVSNLYSLKEFAKNNIIKAMRQLKNTEAAMGKECIKVVLIYEDYIETDVMDKIFLMPECDVENDDRYWLVTIGEMERLLFTFKNDKVKFMSIMEEKIRREREHDTTNGLSLDSVMEQFEVIANEHLKQEQFEVYKLERTESIRALLSK